MPRNACWCCPARSACFQTPDGSLPADPLQQLEIALDNLVLNLEAANMSVKDIVKLTLYLVDPIDAAERRRVLAAYLDGNEPCMTLLFVAALGTPHLKVEIDALASTER